MREMSSLRSAVVAYVPTPHKGYLDFFRASEGETLYILGNDFISKFPSLTRHLPGNDPEVVKQMLSSLNIFSDIRILNVDTVSELDSFEEIIMPDEDVSHAIAKEYFETTKNIKFDSSWRLRWDWDAVTKKNTIDDSPTMSFERFDREMLERAHEVAAHSSDWWRQVGAVLIKEREIVLAAFNKHFPSEQSSYVYGDPRSNFEAGKSIEVSSSLHAEIGLISEAARKGISTENLDLYVTTFPCPTCAYACANSGIKRLFYGEGYSLLEGKEALESRGVEIIQVKIDV